MEPGHRRWIMIICLAAACSALITLLSFSPKSIGKAFIARDALDPLAEIVESHANGSVERLNPYQLGQRLAGLNGMAFVFGTQARPFQNSSESSVYTPLYAATVVIAVNRSSNAANAIDGWHSLLESGATVLMPHNATEGGRLATAAMSRGLGAAEGDFKPALDALADLYAQGRLNPQSDYFYSGYEYAFKPDRLSEYDAVVLWDYQAGTLERMSDEWNIVVPVEGAFTVDCGFICAGLANTQEALSGLRAFLSSEQGEQAFFDAGFSPFTEEVDLSAWDSARLVYNPAFRRVVLSTKLYGPASVLERLLLQSVTLLLFCVAAQRVLRRIPKGAGHDASFYSMLLIALWMMIGIAKTLTFSYTAVRYFWFATYIPRHLLPLSWCCMCFVHRYGRLPSRKTLLPMISAAVLLTAFIFTNDLHRQIFIYERPDPSSWADHYSYGWGYYVSLLWSFAFAAAGGVMLIRQKKTRRQRRQMVYAAAVFVLLIIYQALYIAGVKHITDLDIPTTVAILILVFNFAAQQERFMGASLLHLPIFRYSSYGIAVYDGAGRAVYRNEMMQSAISDDLSPVLSQADEASEVVVADKTFKARSLPLDAGRALVLEDITEMKRLEQLLRQSHQRLNAARELLVRQSREADSLSGSLERERYARQMDALLHGKLKELRRSLGELDSEAGQTTPVKRSARLRRVRFLVCMCQRRLRLIIQSMETNAALLAEWIERYAADVIRDGQRLGLDGVFTASSDGTIAAGIVPALLESIDRICLAVFDCPGASLVCRMEADENGVAINAMLSMEDRRPLECGSVMPKSLMDDIIRAGGYADQQTDEDGIAVRLCFRSSRKEAPE